MNRNREKSERLKAEIERDFGVPCDFLLADFSRLAEVRAAAEALAEGREAIDLLIHNAGIYNTRWIISVDGLEEVFQVDYLASFIISYALRERLRREGKARILLVNSEGHRFAIEGLRLDDLDWERRHYAGLRSYGSAKTFQRPSPARSSLPLMPKAVNTPFPGILQAGQWSYSPAGIPTAILTGWYAQDAIRKRGH